jgi:hypothetical protein
LRDMPDYNHPGGVEMLFRTLVHVVERLFADEAGVSGTILRS